MAKQSDVAGLVNERRGGEVVGLAAAAEPVNDAVSALPPTAAEILRSDLFKRPRRTFPTGFVHLDEKIAGGLKSRQQSIIAAPTGAGKTGLVGTLMLGFSSVRPTLWVCTELPLEEQSARYAALAMRQRSAGCYTPDDLLSHEIPTNDVAEALEGRPLHLLRVKRRDPDPFGAIIECANAVSEKYGEPPIIAVDYLQKLANGSPDQLRASVSDVSEQLLDVADRLDTHVVAISSVSRAFYNATARKLRKQATDEDPRDWLACGKESGDLEYDAALLMFLDVGDDADFAGNKPARLVVAKARGGGEGFYGLRFHGPSGLFVQDGAAASQLKAGQDKAQATNVDKIKADIRKRITRRKKPFTSKNEICDLLGGTRAHVLHAIAEMFDDDQLTMDGKAIVLAPPDSDDEA